MSDANIKKHLRAALDEAINSEKARVHEILDDADQRSAVQREMLAPLLTLIEALRDEVGEVDGLEISTAPHGHIAHVRVTSSTFVCRLSISTTFDNSKFEIEEYSYYTFADGDTERKHRYDTADEAMQYVIKVVGNHIGSAEAHEERKK
jgi:hypothetical protein